MSDALAAIRAALAPLVQTPGECQDVVVDTGLTYRPGDTVLVTVRRRDRRYDIADDGAAVSRTSKPSGWLGDLERLVAQHGFNVNRRGVIFVPAVEGRDIAALTQRLGAASREAYLALLEAAEPAV